MKKILMAVMVFISILIFSTVAYAADTLTKISLDDKAKFSVSLQSNTLVFCNEPTDKTYDSISIDIPYVERSTVGNDIYIDRSKIVRNTTYNRGQGDGATIDLAGLSDGTYSLDILYIVYVNKFPKTVREEYAITIEVKGGNVSFKYSDVYLENLKVTANERTDVYALDFYKRQPPSSSNAAYIKQANLITAGITDDYLKVKAIHDWVANNMYYDNDCYYKGKNPAVSVEVFLGAGVSKVGVCANYADLATRLCQAAGFPAKYIGGPADGPHGWESHAWTEVYVDNRWVFMDPTWDGNNTYIERKYSEALPCSEDYFDMPIVQWSANHRFESSDDYDVWNGSLCIVDANTDNVLKEIKKYPFGSLVTSTYGYKSNDMYSDAQCTKHWNFATDKFSYYSSTIYVKTARNCNVMYYLQADNAYKSLINYTYTNAKEGSKLTAPKTPTKKGYKFVGWYDDPNPKYAKKWDFIKDTVKNDMLLVARWKK